MNRSTVPVKLSWNGTSASLPARCRRSMRWPALHLLVRIQAAVDLGVAHDGLNVVAGLGERDRFDELGDVAELGVAKPVVDAVGSGVIRGERVLDLSVVAINHLL